MRFIEVTEGVQTGEQVITIGNHTLEDNSPITLETDSQNSANDTKKESEKTKGKSETTE